MKVRAVWATRCGRWSPVLTTAEAYAMYSGYIALGYTVDLLVINGKNVTIKDNVDANDFAQRSVESSFFTHEEGR